MKKLLIALAAAGLVGGSVGAFAADQPYTAKPQAEKPGRAADQDKDSVKAGGATDKAGRTADEQTGKKKKHGKKKMQPQ